ncbi:MAG: hypothetical protein Kow0029_21100 [Candidatus Rifleibacteriota bacterium]
MASKLFYLMTFLPALPDNLGDPLTEEDALARIRDEADENLLLLADLLDAENLIEKTAIQAYVLNNSEFKPELSERLPEEFTAAFMRFKEVGEAVWLTDVYTAWFNLMIELSGKVGSKLLSDWAKWEFSLRTALRIERMKNQTQQQDLSLIIPEFMNNFDFNVDHSSLVEGWKAISDPMAAEKYLDQNRIDFLRGVGASYSFDVEELVAYMLELRIHKRYARLSPEQGRKLLEEVTAL